MTFTGKVFNFFHFNEKNFINSKKLSIERETEKFVNKNREISFIENIMVLTFTIYEE